MKKSMLLTGLLIIFGVTVFGQINEEVETNWDGVSSKLEICRQDGDHLYVQVVFTNSLDEKSSPGFPLYFKDIYLINPDNDAKVFILKDADGKYLAGPDSDGNDGGRWWVNVPPEGSAILWAMFPPAFNDGDLIDVVIPEIFPFEGIEIQSASFDTGKTHSTNLFPARASLVSARRSSGAVSARMRLVNESDVEVESNALYYKDAYLYDPVNCRKYPVLKDSEGIFIAEPMSDKGDGGRWWPSYMNKTGKALMYMKFQAPPDEVGNVDIVVPKLVPFLNVKISGKSGVTENSGIEVRGVQNKIKRVLKDLSAMETEEEIRIQLSSEILFEFDSYELSGSAEPVLKKVLRVIQEYPGNAVVIEGHTDNKGTDSYNQTLSENRAESVKDWLVSSGGDSGRLQAIGYGESKPVASNETDEGRGKNRRVEITIKK